MSDLPVSIVIVSRGRADILGRCLLGVSQLQYDCFEVIVVADPDGLEAARKMPFADDLKLVGYDVPNISAARNLGIEQAAGEIVAFIDDDAVPEPQWLHYLVAPAQQSDVGAMGGYVRGRNGISWQWQARSLDRLGETHPLEIHASRATVLRPPKGKAIKTEGTNMAFRRSVLTELGGFDPAFHYYLDETDLNLRMARAGYATALVPLAEVHHGFAPNRMRSQSRVPTDLFDIGASWAVFQRKHLVEPERAGQWKRLRSAEHKRLLRHMVSGGLEPRAVKRLMGRLETGYDEGMQRPIIKPKLAAHPATAFKLFPSKRRLSTFLGTRPMGFGKTMQDAVQRVKRDEIVTVVSLSPSSIYHQVTFTPDGVWVQKGGLFGKSDRKMPLFHMTTRSRRLEKEKLRVARQRGLRDN